MIKTKMRIIVASILCTAVCFSPVFNSVSMAKAAEKTAVTENDEYSQRFLTMWNKLHDSKNGYFRDITQDGQTLKVPYHSVETMMCEAPDYGHETTSEAYSYYMWLEAMYGKFTGNWTEFQKAWDSADKYIIPHGVDQAGMNTYKPDSPATLMNEYPTPDKYPSKLQFGKSVGKDPINNELKNAYNSSEMYGMHWLLDVDNWYGYGNRGNGSDTNPSYINTFQRGPQESVWETVTHPSYEAFKWGGKNGYLDLFTGDNNYSKQLRYTNAPDADARAIQATYWADEWAKAQGKDVSQDVSKASKMGDYLRYSMFDKYFEPIGIGSNNPSNTNEHYLLSWYYSWGAGADGNWSWKIGSSHNHFGYQNPMTAWIMSKDSDFKPKSANGASDWNKSLDRQLEFYQWLQSSEGAIAGGATNSYTNDNGSYQKYPEGTPTFYGMAYDWQPVYHDPPSNNWFGMQVWSMQRVAEYYYKTGDKRAQAILDKWTKWVKSVVKLNTDGTYSIPNNLSWSGEPDTWNGTYTGNPKLHVTVTDYTTDIGMSSSLANTLMYYAAGTSKHSSATYDDSYANLAKEILDRMWNKYQDDKGLSVTEDKDFSRMFTQEIYIPDGWNGKMPNGDVIKPGVKFIDIRSKYKQDPDFARVQADYQAGRSSKFNYHRFWQEAEAAIANGTYSILSKEIVNKDIVLGDANGDKVVDVNDYNALQDYLLDPSTQINSNNADLNKDGRVNSEDLLELKKMITNK